MLQVDDIEDGVEDVEKGVAMVKLGFHDVRKSGTNSSRIMIFNEISSKIDENSLKIHLFNYLIGWGRSQDSHSRCQRRPSKMAG